MAQESQFTNGLELTPVSGSYAVDAPSPDQQIDLQAEIEKLRGRVEKMEASDKKRKESDEKKKASDATKPTVKWSGELQADTYFFDQDAASKAEYGDIENGTDFRRARIAMLGEYGPTEYRIEMDYAQPGRPTFLDVWAGLKDIPGIGRIRAGHMFEPFLLDRMTSNRYAWFMERSIVDSAFAPARNTGVATMNTYADENITMAAGVFRSDSDNFGDDVGDNFEDSFTGRLTCLPYYDDQCGDNYMHLGFGYSFRGANNEQVRFRSQPESREGAVTTNVPNFVDTGLISADYSQLLGFEHAIVYHSFAWQSEYVMSPVHTQNFGNVTMQGAYTQASFFLTGEHHPYKKDTGTSDRVKPLTDFIKYHGNPEDACMQFGPGAWEIAARLSYLDLNNGGVRGGQLMDMTIGLNWYLNQYLRITSNYIRAFAESNTGINSTTDVYAMRVHFEF
jgi:phosphate-selective porin OprO/OprP